MNEEEMLVDPLALLDMSEDEIDQVLGQESGEGGAVSGKAAPEITEDKELSDLLGSNNELADIQDMLSMPDGSEMTVDEGACRYAFWCGCGSGFGQRERSVGTDTGNRSGSYGGDRGGDEKALCAQG